MEFAYGIPGSIGGAIRMNAGAHGGQMQDVIKLAKYIDFDGCVKTLQNKELQFDYRQSIFSKNRLGMIIQATLELEKGNLKEIEDKMNMLPTEKKNSQFRIRMQEVLLKEETIILQQN